MKNLNIRRALIFIGGSLILTSNVGCAEVQAETMPIIEVVDNTPDVTETPIVTATPTVRPTQTPKPTATPKPTVEPISTMIPEPAEENKRYCYDLTEEELLELEQQVSDLYDEMCLTDNGYAYIDGLNITKEELYNFLYLVDGRLKKYENRVNHITTAYNLVSELMRGLCDNNVAWLEFDHKYMWECEEILSRFYPKDTEEYRIIRNLEIEYRRLVEHGSDEELLNYFLKYVDLITNKVNDEMDISNLSASGIIAMDMVLNAQSHGVRDKINKFDIYIGYGNENYPLDDQLEYFFVFNSADYVNYIVDNKLRVRY